MPLLYPPQDLKAQQDTVATNCHGNRIVIGSPFDSTRGEHVGSAYLYDDSGNLLRVFTQPHPRTRDYFGSSVAINCDGTRIVVGAHNARTEGSLYPGAAYLFDESGCLLQTFYNPELELANTNWIEISNTTTKDDQFGKVVAINHVGDRIVISSPARDEEKRLGDVRSNAGMVFIYNDKGNLLKTLSAPKPNYEGEFFGRDISINADGSKILVGSPIRRRAYLFNSDGDVIVRFGHKNATLDRTSYGSSVSMDENSRVIAIGAPGGAEEDDPNGSVYLYDHEGNLGQIVTSPQPQKGDAFGASVSVNGKGDTILVGSPHRDSYGTTYRMDKRGNEYSFLYTDENGRPDLNQTEGFGWSIAQDKMGQRAVISNFQSKGITLICLNDDQTTDCPKNTPPSDIEPISFNCYGRPIELSHFHPFHHPILRQNANHENKGSMAGLLILVSLTSTLGYFIWRKFHYFLHNRRRRRIPPTESDVEMMDF